MWVNKQEIEAIAALLGHDDLEAFKRRYVRRIGIRTSLKELSGGDCVFFDNQAHRCTVYEARPRQCRSWPFWPSNVKTPKVWAQTCEACPGSGAGRLYSSEKVASRGQVIRI